MTKADLTSSVAMRAGMSRAEAGRAVDAVLGAITDTLRQGGKVALPGFGTFSVVERAARMGRSPITRERIYIPAARVPRFRAGSGLKSAVR